VTPNADRAPTQVMAAGVGAVEEPDQTIWSPAPALAPTSFEVDKVFELSGGVSAPAADGVLSGRERRGLRAIAQRLKSDTSCFAIVSFSGTSTNAEAAVTNLQQVLPYFFFVKGTGM